MHTPEPFRQERREPDRHHGKPCPDLELADSLPKVHGLKRITQEYGKSGYPETYVQPANEAGDETNPARPIPLLQRPSDRKTPVRYPSLSGPKPDPRIVNVLIDALATDETPGARTHGEPSEADHHEFDLNPEIATSTGAPQSDNSDVTPDVPDRHWRSILPGAPRAHTPVPAALPSTIHTLPPPEPHFLAQPITPSIPPTGAAHSAPIDVLPRPVYSPLKCIHDLVPDSRTKTFFRSISANVTSTLAQAKTYLDSVGSSIRSFREQIRTSLTPQPETTPAPKRTSRFGFLAALGLALTATHSVPNAPTEHTNSAPSAVAQATPTTTPHRAAAPRQVETITNIAPQTVPQLTQEQTIYLQGERDIPDTFLSALYGYMHSPDTRITNPGYRYQQNQATYMLRQLFAEQPTLQTVLRGNLKGYRFTFATDTRTHQVVLVQAYNAGNRPLLTSPVSLPGSLI